MKSKRNNTIFLFLKTIIFFCQITLIYSCRDREINKPLFSEVRDTVYLNNENWFYISDQSILKVKNIDFYEFSFSLLTNELLEGGLIGFDSTKIFFTDGKDLKTYIDFSQSIGYSIKTENTVMTLFHVDSITNIYYFFYEQYFPVYLHSDYEGFEIWAISKEKGIIDNCYCSKSDSTILINHTITGVCKDSLINIKLNKFYRNHSEQHCRATLP